MDTYAVAVGQSRSEMEKLEYSADSIEDTGNQLNHLKRKRQGIERLQRK